MWYFLRIKSESEVVCRNEEHTVVVLFFVFYLFPHFIAHVVADEHIDCRIFRFQSKLFGFYEVFSHSDVAQIADFLLFEESERLLLLKKLQSGDIGIVVADVLSVKSIDK
jgi:hypothetical protein